MRDAVAGVRRALAALRLRMVRDVLLLSGGELGSKVVSFAAFAYLARALDPAAYGAVELAISLSLAFGLLVESGLGPIGARDVAQDRTRVATVAAAIPSARLLLALLAVPAMCAAPLVLGQPPRVVVLVGVFALGLLAVPFRQQWLFQGLEMMKWISLAQVLRTAAFAVGVVCVVRSSADTLWVGAIEVGAAFGVAAFLVVLQVREVTPFRLSLDVRASVRLVGEGLYVGLSRTVWAMNQYVATMLIAAFVGSVELAFFASAQRIVTSLATFSWIYHFNLFPAFSKALAESDTVYQALVRPSYKATAWAGIGLALVLSLAAEPLCSLVFGRSFADSGPVLALLAWTIPALVLSGHARWALVARGQQRYLLFAQIAGAATALVVGWLAVGRFGAVGGAAAMLASALVVWVVAHAFACRRVVRLPSLEAVAQPALTALTVWLAVRDLDASPLLVAAGAGLAFALLAPVLDGRLIADLGALATAKEGLGGVSPPAPSAEAVG